MAENHENDTGCQVADLESPMVTDKAEIFTEKEISNSKIGLNRSESCGSILQGTNGIARIKNLSRRVSFPSDDKLISGYNEPRNPWENVHDTTTEELIQAYTQSCQTWNVRPITKLLVQLQEIQDFTVRANSLTLKGERLESRVVETLETIFKRVQFITIDLEATNLDEDAAAALFDMIEYYESAVNVLVGFNKNLGNRGWQAAAHMMRKMSCLRLFDGHSVPLSIQASPFVGRALRLSNTLVTLHLENAMLTGRPVLLIVAALRMNTTLKELFLADNRLSPLDALQLANLLKFNRILQLLDLRNNPIQDLGLGHLCAGLMAQSGSAGLNGATGGLQTLVLWNNQISHESMPKLAMALRYTVSLATLNLGQNVLCDDGILRLKEGLLQNHSLIRLGLVGTMLTDEGGVAIAEYLAESPRIVRLDLRNNNIRVAGLMALSLAFKINHSLLRLDIDKPNKKDTQLKELMAKQECLMNDLVSYAQRNKQLAIERHQAIQQRQEEARQMQLREENGLRYMDMTNVPASPSTNSGPSKTSVNNSNNSTPDTEVNLQKEEKSEDKSNRSGSVLTSEKDDTPEDSPEFLPRSSVSYHQVSPVMLSGSEMVKRAAAAARLGPVSEKNEDEGLAPGHGPNDALVDEVLSATDTKLSLEENSNEETDNRPKNETTISARNEIPIKNIEINNFANEITSNVLSNLTTSVSTGTENNNISTNQENAVNGAPSSGNYELQDLNSEKNAENSADKNDSSPSLSIEMEEDIPVVANSLSVTKVEANDPEQENNVEQGHDEIHFEDPSEISLENGLDHADIESYTENELVSVGQDEKADNVTVTENVKESGMASAVSENDGSPSEVKGEDLSSQKFSDADTSDVVASEVPNENLSEQKETVDNQDSQDILRKCTIKTADTDESVVVSSVGDNCNLLNHKFVKNEDLAFGDQKK